MLSVAAALIANFKHFASNEFQLGPLLAEICAFTQGGMLQPNFRKSDKLIYFLSFMIENVGLIFNMCVYSG